MMRSDVSDVKFESSKFETLRTIDQSSDTIGIERQHSNVCVIVIYYKILITICFINTNNFYFIEYQ